MLQFIIAMGIALALAQTSIAACTESNPSGCDISPAILEVNLGPLPVDRYLDRNNSDNVLPVCPATQALRSCIIDILKGYKSQGVTGVRFQFGLGGGGYSTPWDADGNIRRKWANNLGLFFSDVSRTVGIKNITPTPNLGGFWGGDASVFYSDQLVSSCTIAISNILNNGSGLYRVTAYGHGMSTGYRIKITGVTATGGMDTALNGNIFTITKIDDNKIDLQGTTFVGTYVSGGEVQPELRFMVWLPYGQRTDNFYPDCQDKNNAYLSSVGASNPVFWGWQPFFNLIKMVLSSAVARGLNVEELDLNNEIDLLNFTIQARLIYDNTTSPETDILGTLRGMMNTYFGSGASNRVTFSTTMSAPASDGYNCGSVYGDTAMIVNQSELTAAYGNSYIGIPYGIDGSNGLACGGSICDQYGQNCMFQSPLSYSQPSLNDFHAYVCIWNTSAGRCNDPQLDGLSSDYGSATARNFYNGIWSFFVYRNFTSHTAMIGETNHMQDLNGANDPCWSDLSFDLAMAYSNVNGFNGYDGTSSTLYQNAASNTVVRPWENIGDRGNGEESCYVMPNEINPPYSP